MFFVVKCWGYGARQVYKVEVFSALLPWGHQDQAGEEGEEIEMIINIYPFRIFRQLKNYRIISERFLWQPVIPWL